MNARGKSLSDFENFKADLIANINDDELPKKIDNNWTDVFWKYNFKGQIDGIFFSFINRFVVNEMSLGEWIFFVDPNQDIFMKGKKEMN